MFCINIFYRFHLYRIKLKHPIILFILFVFAYLKRKNGYCHVVFYYFIIMSRCILLFNYLLLLYNYPQIFVIIYSFILFIFTIELCILS